MAKFHPLRKRWGTASDKVLQKMVITDYLPIVVPNLYNRFFIIFQTEITETNLNQLNGSCLIIFRSHQNSTDLHGKLAIDFKNGPTGIKKSWENVLVHC